ncbi:hypothetical protein GCM10025864_24540 [Luteimicrobium album]|uniref:Uncharacterized protein n=1 Tax=Luteimicrobium album TaxID=1054550 RepID=A0ABQ6I2E9_9MICO|nr:hypothetical protein GCM10025864_24540 [Luteimicrobium album]
MRRQPPEEVPPGRTVGTQRVDRALEVTVGEARPAAVERLRVGHLGDEQLDAVREAERLEERRCPRHRVHGRAHVVHDAVRQPEVERARATAHRVLGLQHEDPEARACQRDRCREAVRPRPHDDDVSHPSVPAAVQTVAAQSGRTCSACGPFWPCPTSNSTCCPSSRDR